MTRIRFVIFGSALAVALTMLVVATGLTAYESPEDFTSRWLHSVAGHGDADRGWSQLDTTSRERFGDAAAYARAAAEEDWSAFAWKLGDVHQLESWVWAIWVHVDGGLPAVPEFLRANRLVGPLCVDDESPGLQLMVFREGLFSAPTLGSGGLTGGAERALAMGRCSISHGPPAEFEPGQTSTWTGHAFSIRNNTTTPLSLQLEDGRRVDIEPCSTVDADQLSSRIEVRAADGYVATMEGVEQFVGPTVTTFVVIGVADVYVNAAPPIEPLPPCDTAARVQVGF